MFLSVEGERIHTFIENVAVGLEVLAVVIIVGGIVYAMFRFGYLRFFTKVQRDYFREFKGGIGNALLLGLEILIAADIVQTVALDPSVESVGVLGLLVLIRTFLSWSLVVDIEERWPWQPKKEE